MVKRSYELWESIQASTVPLYTETGALWMHRGDDAYVRSAAPILEELAFPLEKLTIAEAKKRYPQIDFTGIKSIWFEGRAGALSARRGCEAVRDTFVRNGGTYRTEHVDPAAILDGSRTDADAYVFACGPWLGRLFPDVIGNAIQPTRQEVYYFGTPRGSDRYRPDRLPVWIDFGERIFYGVPDVHGRGFKVADDTRGEAFDPTTGDRTPAKEGIDRARRLLAERFPEMAKAPLLDAEVCQYENSPDGHLVMDRHPRVKNVWLVGGGSGHGYKLSPAVGEMMAAAVVSEKELPPMFAVARLRDARARSTQFDKK
jgi:glycine/D-amino acid oxidase-like deaminating enzyme